METATDRAVPCACAQRPGATLLIAALCLGCSSGFRSGPDGGASHDAGDDSGADADTDADADSDSNDLCTGIPDGGVSAWQVTWAARAGAPGDGGDQARAVIEVADGSILVGGQFHGMAVFGEGTVGETWVTSEAWWGDAFLARYGPDGVPEWVSVTHGVPGGDNEIFGVAALPDGSSYVTGRFTQEIVLGLGEPNETALETPGMAWDIFVARYNPEGLLEWAVSAGAYPCPVTEMGGGVAALEDESAVVVGAFGCSAVFGQGTAAETWLLSAGLEDMFMARYDPDGGLVWVKGAGGAEGNDGGWSVAALQSGGIAVTGRFEGAVVLGPGEPGETWLEAAGESSHFLARYDDNGVLLWARDVGVVGRTEECGWFGPAVHRLGAGDLAVSGHFQGSMAVGAGEAAALWETEPLASAVYLTRYDETGQRLWARAAGGAGDERDMGLALTELDGGQIVVAGRHTGETVFGEGEPGETVLPFCGDVDAFVAAYEPDSSLAWAMGQGGNGYDVLCGAAPSGEDTVFLAGFFSETVLFSTGHGPEWELTADPGMWDIVVLRLDRVEGPPD